MRLTHAERLDGHVACSPPCTSPLRGCLDMHMYCLLQDSMECVADVASLSPRMCRPNVLSVGEGPAGRSGLRPSCGVLGRAVQLPAGRKKRVSERQRETCRAIAASRHEATWKSAVGRDAAANTLRANAAARADAAANALWLRRSSHPLLLDDGPFLKGAVNSS